MVLGSVPQAASGMGAGLVVALLLSLIALHWAPGPCVAANLLLSGLMAYRGRGHWQRQHLGSMLLGLLAGIALGGVQVAALPLTIQGVLFGVPNRESRESPAIDPGIGGAELEPGQRRRLFKAISNKDFKG